MWYSARVQQNLKHLSRRYEAEVDWEAFEELYKQRAEGGDIQASRDLQRNLKNPETEIERRISEFISSHAVGITGPVVGSLVSTCSRPSQMCQHRKSRPLVISARSSASRNSICQDGCRLAL
jgi:hypothetical protein